MFLQTNRSWQYFPKQFFQTFYRHQACWCTAHLLNVSLNFPIVHFLSSAKIMLQVLLNSIDLDQSSQRVFFTNCITDEKTSMTHGSTRSTLQCSAEKLVSLNTFFLVKPLLGHCESQTWKII